MYKAVFQDGGAVYECIIYTVLHMWQSCVEIEGYSVAYFKRIAVFEAPYH